MNQKLLYSFFSVLLFLSAGAQNITHGPMIGGVTPNSARVYIRTGSAMSFDLEYSTDSLFSSFLSISSQTDSSLDNSKITDINNLLADTKYFIRFRSNNQIENLGGQFRTFPPEGSAGHLLFVTGSCQETANMKVYDVMPRHNPNLFIHIGDFTYPSYQIPAALGYPQNWSAIELAWRRRNEEPVCKDMLRNIPIAYMPDDDDTWGNSRYYKNTPAKIRYENGKLINYFDLIPRTPEMRTNCLQGYKKFFPGYPMVNDTDGYYHSFKVGNCEFFMLDVRCCNTGGWNSLEYNPTLNWWTFNDHNPHQSILSEPQLDWFLNAIKNSTATWKFIMSGVPFNQNIQKLISLSLLLQGVNFDIANQTGTGFRVSSSFADYWGSYPVERNKVLRFIQDNNIQNVIVVSGDTHGFAIDDGKNAGLPEMNASGLSVTSTELYYQFNNVLSTFGFDLKKWLWDQGGMGIGNDDTKNAFGQMEVFGDDSVQLCIYDEDDVRIACYTVKNNSVATAIHQNQIVDDLVRIFPNPASNLLTLELNKQYAPASIQKLTVFDMNGKEVSFPNLSYKGKDLVQLNISSLAKGAYFISLETKDKFGIQKFLKQ